VLLVPLLACAPDDGARRVVRSPVPVERARPTEVAQTMEEEERSHETRREAFERRHRAPPGVDWRAVERDNAARAITRANERRRSAPPPYPAWLERGSDNQAGSSWEVVPTGDALYSGSDRGGLWRAAPDGSGWEPIGDVLFGGVHFLAVLPARERLPEVLLTSPVAAFPHRSEDGGATWTVPGGLEAVTEVRGLAASTDGQERVWLSGLVGQTGRLFVSDDRGATFRDLFEVGPWGDLWVHRDGGSAVVTASTDRMLVSADGRTFATKPVPEGLAEVRVAASESTDPLTVWLAGRRGGTWSLFRWDEPSWTELGPLPDFWWVFTASIRDPALLAYGGVDLHVSRDAGATFSSPNTWDEYYADPATKLHADLMALSTVPGPDGTETWYVGTHGGPYRSDDGWRTARNLALRGLRIGQYYASHTDRTDADRVLVGSQDQGLQSGRLGDAAGPTRAVFEQEISGDYGHLVSLSGGSHDRVAMVYPGFVLVRVGLPGGVGAPLYYDYPPGESPFWLPVLVAEPRGRNAFWFLGTSLWRYRAEPDRTDFDVEEWTRTDLGLEGYEQLSGLVFAPTDPERAWLVSTAGRIWRSDDGARRWEALGGGLPFGSYYYGTALVASRRREGTLYVGGSGYDGRPVWRSTDAGTSFEAWSEGLPPTTVNALVELRDGSGRVLAGTDTGVWLRGPDDAEWVDVSSGAAPITTYWSAELLPDENTVRWSTYGRGLWDLRFAEPGEGCFSDRDDDGDGAACDVDCDDGDPDTAPGVVDDVCDGVDHDCVASEGDADGDGHLDCADCEPDDPDVFPWAPDAPCDGIDQDCDGYDACDSTPRACGCAGAPAASGAAWLLAPVAAALSSRRRRTSR
jgi:hypothetical protein